MPPYPARYGILSYKMDCVSCWGRSCCCDPILARAGQHMLACRKPPDRRGTLKSALQTSSPLLVAQYQISCRCMQWRTESPSMHSGHECSNILQRSAPASPERLPQHQECAHAAQDALPGWQPGTAQLPRSCTRRQPAPTPALAPTLQIAVLSKCSWFDHRPSSTSRQRSNKAHFAVSSVRRAD